MRGELETLEAPSEARKFSGEMTDLGESSEDSAIVSVDRIRTDPSASRQTTLTSIPSTSKSIPMPSTSSKRPSIQTIKDRESDKESRRRRDSTRSDKSREEKRKLSVVSKIRYWGYVFLLFVKSCLISVTAKLNSVSRDYRYVARRLAVEKRALKVLLDIEESDGVRYDSNWKKLTLAKISQASVPKLTKSFDSTESLRNKKALTEMAEQKLSKSDE